MLRVNIRRWLINLSVIGSTVSGRRSYSFRPMPTYAVDQISKADHDLYSCF